MKRNFTLFFSAVLCICLYMTSCVKKPNASFSVSNSNPKVGEYVSFSNTSSDAKSYSWNFGDGQSSMDASPSHVYYRHGTYTVTLTAYSKNEKKNDVATSTITVKAVGDAMFWTDYTTEYIITVTLNNVNKNITSYYYSVPSNCGASGCATFSNLEPGVYYYYAENYLYWWSGYITVIDNECSKMLLYASKGNRKTDTDGMSSEMLIPGVDE